MADAVDALASRADVLALQKMNKIASTTDPSSATTTTLISPSSSKTTPLSPTASATLGLPKCTTKPSFIHRRETRVDSSISLSAARASIISGYIAGSFGLLIGHPLDSLKVLLQTQIDPPPGSAPQKTPPIIDTLKEYFTLTKLRSLYAGILPPLVTVGLIQSLNFFLYDFSRRTIYNFMPPSSYPDIHSATVTDELARNYLNNDSLWGVALASSASGAVISLVTSPLTVIKTNQQIKPGRTLLEITRKTYAPTVKSPITGMLPVPSLRNFYVGFGAHLICESPGRAVYFVAYESLKRFQTSRRDAVSIEATLGERVTAAAGSGILCWTCIFPFDVVRSRIMAYNALNPTSCTTPTTLEMASSLYARGGLRPFFRGIGLTVLRAGPVACAVLPIYDFSFQYFAVQVM